MTGAADPPPFLEPQRAEARRLFEVEWWSFAEIARHFGTTKNTVVGLSYRQGWKRTGSRDRADRQQPPARPVPPRQRRSKQGQTLPGPRGAPAPAPPEPPVLAPEEPPVGAAPVADAPDSAATASEDSASPGAERDSPPAVAVAAEEVVAGASSADPASEVAEHSAAPGERGGAVPMVVRPRAARGPDAGDRSTAERRLDTILGHARVGAAPPVLTMPRAPVPTARPRECQWPLGEPGAPGFRFCGAASEPSRPYCLAHCAVAYVRQAQKGSAA